MIEVTAFKNSQTKAIFGRRLSSYNFIDLSQQIDDEDKLAKDYVPQDNFGIALHKIFRERNFFERLFGFNKGHISKIILEKLEFIGDISTKTEKTISKYKIKNKIFVIKISNNKNVITHDAIVGLYGLNKIIENGIPNFVYTYGIRNNIVFTEYINGKSFVQFLKMCSLKQYVSCFTQIILALREAYKMIDFTHYDLHPNNIIVKFTDSNFIKYNDFICPTFNTLAVIVDYETSHFCYMGKHYGNLSYDITHYQVFQDCSYPIYDIYKLLIHTLTIIYQNNNRIKIQLLFPLLTYFYKIDCIPQNFSKFINEILFQNENLVCVAYCRETTGISIEEWDEFKNKYSLGKNYNPDFRHNYTVNDFIDHLKFNYDDILL